MGDAVLPESNSESMYVEAGSNPARLPRNITPSDTDELTPWARGFRVGVGGGGTLTIINIRGESVFYDKVQDSETIPCGAMKVMATGTTVENIVAYYG